MATISTTYDLKWHYKPSTNYKLMAIRKDLEKIPVNNCPF